MTTQVTQYYADLLIAQYANKTKAVDTITLTADKLIDNEIIAAIQGGFDIDTAVGNQLDILGKIVGTSRYITNTILDTTKFYIPLDSSGTKIPITDTKITLVNRQTGGSATSLSDDEFRFLLKLKIIRNYSDNSFKSMDDSIQQFFQSALIASYGIMNIVYFAESSIFDIVIKGASKDLLPRPMGVNIVGIIKTDADTSLFGLYDGTNDNDILIGGLYDGNLQDAGELLDLDDIVLL
jgi:hypothetical protein